MHPNRPIRYLILCGALLIAAIVICTAIMIGNLRNRALVDSERELKNTALVLAGQIDQTFHAVDLVMRSIMEKMQSLGIDSSDEYARQMSGPDANLMLKDKIKGLAHVDAITLIGGDGKLINFSRDWPVPAIDASDRDYFKTLKSDAQLTSFVSGPVHDGGTGTWTVYLARKLTAANGEFLGLILGAMELATFEKLFGTIVLGEHTSITLYRRDGVLLARYPRIETVIGKTFSSGIKALGEGNSGTLRFVGKIAGKDRLLAARRFAHYPLHISVAQDIDAALAGWQKETRIFLSTGGLAALAITAMIFLIVRQLLQGHKSSNQRLALEKQRLDTAINNMSQGLLLFDSSERIVVVNRRYVEIYGLSPDVVKPGCAFRDLLCHRKATGSFAGDVDQYQSAVRIDRGQGKATEVIAQTADGRSVRIVNQPVANGGWVATHEDITDSQRLLHAQHEAERLVREQKLQLDAALNNMVQGLCMFNADGRIVLFNQRYVDMMDHSADDLIGLSLIDLLEHRKLKGHFTGEPEQFVADVIAGVRAGKSATKVVESRDGRALRVVDHPMANGGWVATFEDITEQREVEKERDRHREFLNQIIDNVPVMIAVKDASSRRFVLANRAAEALWGISRTEALGKTARELFPAAQAELIDLHDDEALRADAPLVLEAHPNMGRSGDVRIVTSKRLAIRDDDRKPQFLVSVVEDVTERKLLEQERDRDREFLNQIINNVPTPIIVKDAHTRRYVLINQACEKYFGGSRDQLVGKRAHDAWPKATADAITQHDEQLLQSDGYLFFDEHPLSTPALGTRIVTSKRIVIRDGSGEPQYLLGVIEDVTERKRSDERIAHLAHYDALTDLPNRVLFREQLEQLLKRVDRGEHLALLYLDLDHFKSVNDTLGHPVGDELLKAVATRLRACLRETDIVARLGGDEFAVVQSALAQPLDVVDLVNRIRNAIREPYAAGGHQLVADTSIGIAVAPDDGVDPDQLLKNADLAMYGAKLDGRGTYRFFEPDMDARVKARRALESDLRHALICGDFELYYQPLVVLRDDRIGGCEALVRWHHPEHGMIPPAEFIPVAEETGLINPLGEWVLRKACEEAAAWPDDIRVAVNVSPLQFKSGNLVQLVINALAASGLPAHRLELEITESVLIRDAETTLLILHQLRTLGVRIALDDFGTGYSSLNYLQRFPFDKIKIDRSFIKNLGENDGSLSIVQAVVGIARSRNITTTAEGVETQQQLELLRALGCTEIQGYLFSPPRPAPEILQLLLLGERAVAVA